MEFVKLVQSIRTCQNKISSEADKADNDIFSGAKNAAKMLNVSIHTVMAAVQADRILAVRIGKKLYFSRQWLEDFSKSQNRFKR